MDDPTAIPGPSESEQVRLLASALSDLETVVAIVVENRAELLPGEAAEELNAAWSDARASFARLKQQVLQAADGSVGPKSTGPSAVITLESLKEHQLIGAVGTAKRSILARLRDAFYSYWNSLPRTDDKRIKAAHAAVDLLDCGASIAGSVPFGGPVEEALLLVKQALSLRLRRGY